MKKWRAALSVLLGCSLALSYAGIAQSDGHDVVVFWGEKGIAVLDPVTHGTQEWVKLGYQDNYSVSQNGVIAFSASTEDRQASNVFVSVGLGEAPLKVTDDNKSTTPVISPDGSKVLYQKMIAEKNFNGDPIGGGVWLYDTKSREQHEVVGTVKIPEDLVASSRRSWGGKGKMNEAFWTLDDRFIWSLDGSSFTFRRNFPFGPVVQFWVNLAGSAYNIQMLPSDVYPLSVGKAEIIFENEGKLQALEPRSGIKRLLTLVPKEFENAEFSSDGTQIACLVCEKDDQPCSIWLVSYPEGDLRKLTRDLVDYIDDPVPLYWNKDSSRILVESLDGTWVIDAKSGEAKNLGNPIPSPAWTNLP